MHVAGIVLCGGRSSRMGQAKAWLPFGAERMLPRVVRLLGETVAPVIVVAAPGQDLPSLPAEVEIVRDENEGRGPLQGLATGLAAMTDKADAVYLSSCDVPFLRPAFVRRMCDLLGLHAICVPRIDDYFHPLAAVYRREVHAEVQRLLDAERLRPIFLFDALPTRIVGSAELADVDPGFESLRNLNAPSDYEAALRDAGLGT